MEFNELELGMHIKVLDVLDNSDGKVNVRACGCSIKDVEVALDLGNASINKVRTVVEVPDSLIEVSFDSYISYCVNNDSYTSEDDYDLYEGRLLRVYSRSRFLDYVNMGTSANSECPEDYKHYAIIGVDRIVHIVSSKEPSIYGF